MCIPVPPLVLRDTLMVRLVTAVMGVAESVAHTETSRWRSSTFNVAGMDTVTGNRETVKN